MTRFWQMSGINFLIFLSRNMNSTSAKFFNDEIDPCRMLEDSLAFIRLSASDATLCLNLQYLQ